MAERISQQVQLVARPGPEGPSADNFAVIESPVRALQDGEILLATRYLSLDPFMRARMYAGGNYAAPAQLGAPMIGNTVSEVIETRHSAFAIGTIVESAHGWQSHFVSNGEGLRIVDPDIAPISTALGVLGMPGQTGYGGLLRIGQPRPGDTVCVSAAAGAVGSVVGQVARIKGCRVIGIAGGEAKCRYLLDDLGFDAAIDYRGSDVPGQLKAAAPDGIDVYFDNVGGDVFAQVMECLNTGARIPVCGTIAVDRNLAPPQGRDRMQTLLATVLVKQLILRGFLFTEFADMADDFHRDMTSWMQSGALRYKEHIVDGLENAPEAFLGLFTGANFGKLLVRVGS